MRKKLCLAMILATTIPCLGQLPAIHFRGANSEVGMPAPSASVAEKKYIIQQMSGGVALFDCDDDGKLDIAVVNDSTIEHYRNGGGDPMLTLYHQDKGTRFSDITANSGLTRKGWAMGIAIADYDNDGILDIFVSGYDGNALFHGLGGCRFEDVTDKAGVNTKGFNTGATWGDYDRDGFVDLFVSRYIHTDVDKLGEIKTNYKGLMVEAPWGMKGESDFLFHNRGNGTFEEVGKKAGVNDPDERMGLTAVWADFDNDGWPDLYVANDSEPNYMYRNKHDGTFEDVSLLSGTAVSGEGKALGSMGVDFGDLDRDGRFDITVSTFAYQPIELHHNLGEEGYSDITWIAKTGQPSYRWVKWGIGMLDFDNDGLLDIMVAAGHLYTAMDTLPAEPTYKEPLLLFHNTGKNTFDEVASAAGLNDEPMQSRRGIAFGDINNDGKIDAVIFNQNGPPTIFLNDSKTTNHSVLFKLIGTKSNRAAIGARLSIAAGGVTQMNEVRSSSSYLTHNDIRLHFGLGKETQMTKVEVLWPSGKREVLENVPADAVHTIVEGSGIKESVPFAKP